MSNFETQSPRDFNSIGEEIGQDLKAHQWQKASEALSKCANDLLCPNDFKTLVQAADRANNDLSGITLDPVYDLAKLPALDPVTRIESTKLQKNFAGVEVGLNVPGFEVKPVLITSPADLGQQLLEFGDIYNNLGLSARKP